ncbi:MAG TPA: hypothetical protein VE964_07630 [Myxococcales bacterium]|nr:hypothetical protein [Myxococcales bacterium]
MSIPRIAIALLCAACLSACGNDQVAQLTAFARDLVENHTSDEAQPVEIEGRSFGDAEDPNAFSPAFFG